MQFSRAMLNILKDTFASIGDTTSHYAKRVGTGSAALARRVGPKRGILALAVLAAAVGTAFVVRYFVTTEAATDEESFGGAPTKRQRRRARNHHPSPLPA